MILSFSNTHIESCLHSTVIWRDALWSSWMNLMKAGHIFHPILMQKKNFLGVMFNEKSDPDKFPRDSLRSISVKHVSWLDLKDDVDWGSLVKIVTISVVLFYKTSWPKSRASNEFWGRECTRTSSNGHVSMTTQTTTGGERVSGNWQTSRCKRSIRAKETRADSHVRCHHLRTRHKQRLTDSSRVWVAKIKTQCCRKRNVRAEQYLSRVCKAVSQKKQMTGVTSDMVLLMTNTKSKHN